MKKVLLITETDIPLQRQFPTSKQSWGNYEFYINEFKGEYDFVVVLDNLPKKVDIICPKTSIVLFTCEPESVRIYPNSYLTQFGSIFTCNNIILKEYSNSFRSIPVLPWMTGCSFKENSHNISKSVFMNYTDFINASIDRRLNKICVITSNKRLTKGHRDRIEFAMALKAEYPDKVDIFGNGFESIPDKFDIQRHYKYSIVIENSSYLDYWTEKLSDTYLAGSFPIYFGAPNIHDFFNERELKSIDIHDFEKSKNVIKTILDQSVYDISITHIHKAKIKVLNNYNMFSIIASSLNQLQFNDRKENVSLYPIKSSFIDKIRLYLRK